MLEPVMRYRMALPPDCDSRALLPQLRQLEEEDPQLRFTAHGRRASCLPDGPRPGGNPQEPGGRSASAWRSSWTGAGFCIRRPSTAPVEGVGHF
ncbi:MAG: hypothetical protein ACLUNQ_05600, partial [Oscillospiraceae bacterium]